MVLALAGERPAARRHSAAPGGTTAARGIQRKAKTRYSHNILFPDAPDQQRASQAAQRPPADARGNNDRSRSFGRLQRGAFPVRHDAMPAAGEEGNPLTDLPHAVSGTVLKNGTPRYSDTI
jgi:hypothetical protein